MAYKVEFNEKKFRDLILYIAHKSEADPRLGAVKLNKILFYSDFNAFRELGASISGATYQHLEEGPAPREMLPVRRAMLASEEAKIESRVYFGRKQDRLVPLRPVDQLLSPDERRIVDEVISEFWHMDAKQISRYSHDEYGWRLTDEGESIPYSSALFSADPLTQEQIERGQEAARRHERSP
jgi:hypothetical protein